MNVTLAKSSDVMGVITVSVTEDDYAEKVSEKLKQIRKEANIPGFRKGTVPMGQIKKRFERSVKSDAINDVVYDNVIKYIRDNKLNILGEPLPVKVQEINVEDKDYTFEYEIGLAPQLNIEVDKNVTLPFYNIEVSDKLIDDEDAEISERFGKQEPGEVVDAKAVIKGSMQQLNEDGTVNTGDGAVQVVSTTLAPFVFADKAEAEKFLGKKVDDKVVFNPHKCCNGNPAELSSMLNIDKSIAGDIKNDFEFTISEIILVKPAEHNQEYYDMVVGRDKITTEEQYRDFLKEMITARLHNESVHLFQAMTHNHFVKQYDEMELPNEFLKKWLVLRNEELTSENIDKEYETMTPALKWQLISDAIGTKLDVKINENDVHDLAVSIVRNRFMSYGISNIDDATLENASKTLLENREQRQHIVEQVTNHKLFEAIANVVTLDNKTVSLDEFTEVARSL